MKNLITMFAVLALSLVSCKKEKPLQQSGILTYHAVVEIDADDLNYANQKMYKNGELLDNSIITTYNFRDTLLVKVKNTSFAPQHVSIKLSANDNFIKGSEQDLQSGKILTFKYIF